MKDKKLRQRLFGKNYKTLDLYKSEGLIAKVIKIVKAIEEENKRIVKCEKCKCLIFKEDAIKGKKEIRKRIEVAEITNILYRDIEKDYIYTPYYCHRCTPKKLKDKNEK